MQLILFQERLVFIYALIIYFSLTIITLENHKVEIQAITPPSIVRFYITNRISKLILDPKGEYSISSHYSNFFAVLQKLSRLANYEVLNFQNVCTN